MPIAVLISEADTIDNFKVKCLDKSALKITVRSTDKRNVSCQPGHVLHYT